MNNNKKNQHTSPNLRDSGIGNGFKVSASVTMSLDAFKKKDFHKQRSSIERWVCAVQSGR